MNTPISFGYLTAFWPGDPSEPLAEWRERVETFCTSEGTFTGDDVLHGRGVTIWGYTDRLALFKMFFC